MIRYEVPYQSLTAYLFGDPKNEEGFVRLPTTFSPIEVPQGF